MAYSPEQTPAIYVDHAALRSLLLKMTSPGVKAGLVGFGETAKHLINIAPHHVVCIYDNRSLFKGKEISFRGIPVVDLPEKYDVNLLMCCEYEFLYEYFGRIVRHYSWLNYYYPSTLNSKQTGQIDVFEQQEVYKTVFKNESDAPISMMSKEKIRFLLELMRFGMKLSKTANILEMGTWQGGSAWFMAKMLQTLGESRKLILMDLFETHMMDPTATMCTDEIRIRMEEQYGNVQLIVGLVDDHHILELVDTPICFAHIDLGCQEQALEFAWNALVPGAPLLLDNYGHLAAPTWRFDDFFAERGTSVIRLPWSEQGLVFKP